MNIPLRFQAAGGNRGVFGCESDGIDLLNFPQLIEFNCRHARIEELSSEFDHLRKRLLKDKSLTPCTNVGQRPNNDRIQSLNVI
jgi:hypothetical protein